MNIEQEHFNSIVREIGDELNVLTSKYDSKILAVVLLIRASDLFRACHSVGITTIEETERTVNEILKDLYTPLPADKTPRTEIIGKPMRLS